MEKEGKLKNVGLYEHKSAFYRIAVYLPLAVRKSAKVHITHIILVYLNIYRHE